MRSGRRLALANKESLIAGAPVVQRSAGDAGAEIVPVDSEHCAIHQCLGERRHVDAPSRSAAADRRARARSRRLVVTASGGRSAAGAATSSPSVTIEDALAHPTWKMGPKITIDSSTLMNKGLEVIEAHELFGVGYDEIEVVVHPQSIIHSMVEFCDGATIAQLSNPDMRLPIGYALAYPERFGAPFGVDRLAELRRLDFDAPDLETFRCLALAYAAGRAGGLSAGVAERRERGRGRGVLRRPHRLARRSPRSSSETLDAPRADRARRRSRTCSPPTPRRGASRREVGRGARQARRA